MKTKTQHTPGPWKLELDKKEIIVRDSHEVSLHEAYVKIGDEGRELEEANARLIAAAPDLLNAAKEALAFMGCNGEEYSEAWKMLWTAIDKAEKI